MKKIIIADDDVIVRRYLEEIIQNEMPGFELCGTAKNGEEALKIIEEQQPDLAIIDIDMPGKDGVEVLYELNKKRVAPETKVVVLSCYNDFEYVKNAMKCGAVDYILKYKVDAKMLAKILESVYAEVPSIKVTEHKKSSPQFSKQQDQILQTLLLNENAVVKSGAFINDWASTLHITPENLQVAVGMIDYHDKFIIHNPEESIKHINSEITEIICKYTSVCQNTLTACVDEDKFVMIFSCLGEESKRQQNQNTKEVLQSIQKEVAKRLQLTVSFGVSRADCNITNIAVYYQNAFEALRYKLYVGTDSIIWHSECKFAEEIPGDLYSKINGWSQKSMFSKESGVKLENIFNELSSLRLHYSQYNLLLIRMVGTVISDVADSHSMIRVFGDFDPSMAFVGCETCSDHYHWFENHISRLREGKKEQKCRTEINDAIKYIEDHLSEELTLSLIAEQVNFSKSYFCQLFKQNTGENLVDFIARLRINRAKELLLNSEYKVYEAAAEVGFESQHYFNKLFKSMVGVTPTEYRNMKCFS